VTGPRPLSDGRRGDESVLSDVQAKAALAFVVAVFVALQFASIRFSVSDENVYYYMGKLVADGALPYRDFRFAHPPLRLLPPAAVFAAFGFHFTLLKLIPIAAATATAVLGFAFARRAVSPLAALLGAALFLFSTTTLSCTPYYMGTETTAALVMAGLVAVQRGRPAWAGVWMALASLVGLYAGCAVVVAAAILAWTDRRALVRFAAGFGVVFCAVVGVCLLVGGAAFWHQVVVFQTLKAADETMPKSAVLSTIAGLDPAILALAAVGLALRRKGLGLPLATGLAFLAAIAAFSSIHPYYFTLCAPFLCVVAGDALLSLLAVLRAPAGAAAVTAAVATIALGAFDVRRAHETVARQSLADAPGIADAARRMSDPGDTIFGDAVVAPLVALLADRDILARHVDTNAKVYAAGVDDLASVRRTLSAPWRGVVVVRDIRVGETPTGESVSLASGPMVDDAFRAFVNERFERGAEFQRAEDPRETIVLLVQDSRTPRDGK